jgi:hypothetical protein
MPVIIKEINEENFLIYAAKNYYCPLAIDAEEFYEELKRFKYLKRLFNRYTRGGELCERLILNHITILINVFGCEPAILMLLFKLGPENLSVIKPFLDHLQATRDGDFEETITDPWVVIKLENI